jgi:hypothetical protein
MCSIARFRRQMAQDGFASLYTRAFDLVTFYLFRRFHVEESVSVQQKVKYVEVGKK